jgi:hypothetical protein
MEVLTSTSTTSQLEIVAMREDMESLHTKNSLQCRYEPRTISSHADLASLGYPHFRGCSLGVQGIEAPQYCPYYTALLCRFPFLPLGVEYKEHSTISRATHCLSMLDGLLLYQYSLVAD